MKKILTIIVLSYVFVSSHSFSQSSFITEEERASAEINIRAAGHYLAQNLRDPSSATFRNVFLAKRVNARPGHQITFCGEVNGRNGFGGMTGFQAFMWSGDKVYIGKMLNFDVSYLCRNNDPYIDDRDYSSEIRKAFYEELERSSGF